LFFHSSSGIFASSQISGGKPKGNKRMKNVITAAGMFLILIAGSMKPAEALLDLTSLQVHSPAGPGNPESSPKSQFVMQNDSTSGALIDSILWEFSSPVFIDSASGGAGFGSFLNYTVSSAQTYSGSFDITVGANSDVTTGYTGPTSFTDGINSLFLTFNDFDPNEAFAFWTDLDSTTDSSGRIIGDYFDGTKTTVTFSDGYIEEYVWNLDGNNGRSFFAQYVGGTPTTNVVPEPASLLLLSGGMLGVLARRKLHNG
jgi:hypothetical protein